MTWQSVIDGASYVLFAASGFFFLAGSVGLVRFPDVYTRLHALTKADNLGLGLASAGLALQSGSLIVALKLLLIWIVVIVAGATACYLVANSARNSGIEPWTGESR
ncbi:MAG: monovalent cation/H(+) antiporter subunit G [Coriobacteriia bacterium]|nr:monovalent cation/H(+) antiporter subunit G [Coriobacteriia bacterium]